MRRLILLALMVWFAPSPATASIVLGQHDDFQDSTDHWQIGRGSGPTTADGGPAGTGDRFLKITSTGSGGPGSKLVVLNRNQWTGNFVAAGITQVEMDLKDLSTRPLTIRIAFESATGNGPGFASKSGFALPADGAWHHAVFGLSSADLTALNRPSGLTQILSDVKEFRILDSPSPSLTGASIAASFGVDNMTATTPEPSAVGVLAAAVIALRRHRIPTPS